MNKTLSLGLLTALALFGWGCRTASDSTGVGQTVKDVDLPGLVATPKVFDPSRSLDGKSTVSLKGAAISVDTTQPAGTMTYPVPKICSEKQSDLDRGVWFATNGGFIYSEYCGDRDATTIARLDATGRLISSKDFPNMIALGVSPSAEKAIFYVPAAKEYGIAVAGLDGGDAKALVKVPDFGDGNGASLLPGRVEFSPQGKRVFFVYVVRAEGKKNGEVYENQFLTRYAMFDFTSGKVTDLGEYFPEGTKIGFHGWQDDDVFIIKISDTKFETHRVE